MNWTAILSLLAVLGLPALVAFMAWEIRGAAADALESAKISERAVDLTADALARYSQSVDHVTNIADRSIVANQQTVASLVDATAEIERLKADLEDAERRARRRSREQDRDHDRSAARSTETPDA